MLLLEQARAKTSEVGSARIPIEKCSTWPEGKSISGDFFGIIFESV
jgi:hypothetical protein